MSGALRLGSSWGSGLKVISDWLLVSVLMVCASWRIVVSFVSPMLMVSPTAFSVVVAWRMPVTLSVM